MRLYPHSEEEISCYTWDAFLRHAVYCTNIQGTALYDSTLGDAELIEEMYEEERQRISSKRKQESKQESEYRPPRRGYSREVEALYDVVDNLVALRGEMGRWPRTTTERAMSKRPWFPAEVVQERLRQRARVRRDSAINAAKARWKSDDVARVGT